MVIPYPERVPLIAAAYFALILCVIQALEGTAIYFCIGSGLFILIAAAAFNAAGGLTRASGAYVFFYSTMVVVIGLCHKAFLGEPAQSNLLDPKTDILAYVGTIVAMYATVVVSRRFTRKTPLLRGVLKSSDMYHASIGCMVFGAVATFGISLLGDLAGQIQSAFAQLNLLMPVGIIIGIVHEIRSSGGTRCTNLAVTLGTLYLFFLGATGFSKEGMFVPLVCWLLPIWALRYRLSVVQAGLCAFILFFSFQYLVPFSQYGRDQIPEGASYGERIGISMRLLASPIETRRLFLAQQAIASYEGEKGLGSYYNTPQGFWERLQFVSVDDALNDVTDQGHEAGMMPLEFGFANVVPHFLWPNKPQIGLGNMYYHEITGTAQGEGDTSTGISFSPTAEAYHIAKWEGIFLVAPIMWFMFFVIYDSALGDVRDTPWGMLVVAYLSHSAPEGGITGIIRLISFQIEALVFCVFFAAWFAPHLAAALVGPGRKKSSGWTPTPPSVASRSAS